MTAGRPGIRRFGAYLPRLRLERKAIAAATAFATGSRAGAAQGHAQLLQLGRGQPDHGRRGGA